MYQLEIAIEIRSDIERVFDAISDHEAFFKGPGLRCSLTSTGAPERNGLGAVREISNKGVFAKERVTSFKRPERFEYKVETFAWLGIDSRMRHEGAALVFEQRGEVTRVEWTSSYRIEIPVLGTLFERIGGLVSRIEFSGLLRRVKRELESMTEDG